MSARKLNREQNRRRKFVQGVVKEVMNRPAVLTASPQVRLALEAKTRAFAQEMSKKLFSKTRSKD